MRKSRISFINSALLQSALACLALAPSAALQAYASTPTTSAVLKQIAPMPRLAGQGHMRFLGLQIYDARLWVGPGFDPRSFGQTPFALELTYHRGFSASAIAKRSIQEIQRQRPLSPAQVERWTAQLQQWLPDVQAGERLTGVHLPGQGMRLWHGEQDRGMLQDPELARYFFGIWLSPQTSEPQLRNALLVNLPPSTP